MVKKKTTKKKAGKPKKAVPTDIFGKQVDVLETEFGKNVLESLSSIQARPVTRTSSGSLALDYIMSPRLGGVRDGLMLQLWGPPSTGKTTIALGYAANVTAAKKKVIFLDAEKTFDPSLALAAGIDPEYLHVLRHSAEDAINILYSILKTGQVGAVIIDSISALQPMPKERDKKIDITREQIAYHASFVAKWLPRVADICSSNNILLIVINQARNQLGQHMGGIKAGSGGFTLEHYLAMSIRLQGRAQQSTYRILDAEGRIVGQMVKCTCDKSKIDVPFKSFDVPLFFGLGVNPYMELAALSVTCGAVSKNGGWHYLTDEADAGYIARSADAFSSLLCSDVEMFKKIRSKTIDALGLIYPKGEPFVNPFLNADFTPKLVDYNAEEEKQEEKQD